MSANLVLVKDLVVGTQVEWFYLIKSANLKTSSNNKEYLDLMLQDISGEINAKVWEVPENKEDFLEVGNVVKVRAMVTEWNEKPQLKIVKMRLAGEDDPFDISQLIPSAPEHPDEMYNEILEKVENFTDEGFKQIVIMFLEQYKEKLLYYPAAKMNHHAMFGGLLYHIKRMVTIGENLSFIYPEINKDLLVSGIILHDIEKVNELDSTKTGIVKSYTKEGELLGHITTGIVELGKIELTENITQEKILLLQHMVLSHHYEGDFGSPKKPMFAEAELLHHIDNIDSKMFMIAKESENLEPGTFSDRIWNLDKRKIYKPLLENMEEQLDEENAKNPDQGEAINNVVHTQTDSVMTE